MKASRLQIPLYHGTSSVFLEDILRFGLGGKNPVQELKLVELAREIRPLLDEHLASHPNYRAKAHSFARMTAQESGGWNYQHGDTYVSPCRNTAIRYASSNCYGSELLTNTLLLLQLLLDHEVPTVADEIYRRYRPVFRLLDISAAPILVEVVSVPVADLAAEDGGSPQKALTHIGQVIEQFPDSFDEMLQQTNFRLTAPAPSENLRVSFINVTEFQPHCREYVLYELNLESREYSDTLSGNHMNRPQV